MIPGEAGFSPYEIVFRRQMFLANVPYKSRRECEDAHQFFERMKQTDERVARLLNSLHKAQAEGVNKKRRELKAIPIGTLVWYRRPPGTGGKLDGRWLGPCKPASPEVSWISLKTRGNAFTQLILWSLLILRRISKICCPALFTLPFAWWW